MFIGTLPAVSNRATWADSIETTDDETGEGIDLSAITAFSLQVVDRETKATVLSAALSDVTLIEQDEGGTIIQFEFTPSQMSALCAKTYDVGVTVTADGQTVQEIIAALPVLDGIVS